MPRALGLGLNCLGERAMPIDQMSARPPLLFYAPLKSPDDPVPSGDRTLARLLFSAVRQAGFAPQLASSFRAFSRDGSRQPALLEQACLEARRLAATMGGLPPGQRPSLWFTYHSYYKAPDLLGPVVSRSLGIPYVLAEASHAEKRRDGPFASFHEAAARASRTADLHLVLNRRDLAGLATLRGSEAGLIHLPPFVADVTDENIAPIPEAGPLRLVAAAMMRAPDKLQSYRLLAQALALVEIDWSLDIHGDGEARDEVEAAFAPIARRVRFHGLAGDPSQLATAYRRADALVWPGFNEAFGMSYLEAAAHGRPAVAMRYGGVGEVVEDGVSGLLADAGDVVGLADRLMQLGRDRAYLRRLGKGARAHAAGRHSFASAVQRLASTLHPLLRERPSSCAS